MRSNVEDGRLGMLDGEFSSQVIIIIISRVVVSLRVQRLESSSKEVLIDAINEVYTRSFTVPSLAPSSRQETRKAG